MAKVLITRKIPEKGMQILKDSGIDYILNEEDRPMSREEIEAKIKEVDAMIAMVYDKIDGSLLDMAPRLKIVANHAVGTDNIDISACTERKVAVTNTPGVLTDATADLAFTLILAAARHVVAADKFMREGRFNAWDPLLFNGTELKGKTLGIIGMGRIGQAVAKRSPGFGMKVVYYDERQLPEDKESALGATLLPLDEVVKNADFLSLHLPYFPEVHHLIDKRRLEMMKPGAYLINTARGPLVDEKSLVEHLRAGKIAGAALDVYEHEPMMAPGLADLENVTLLPHLGSATHEARSAMAAIAAQSVSDVISGKVPEHILNPEIF